MSKKIKYLVVHHSNSPMDITTHEKIKQWHLDRGFADIGYHMTIDKYGNMQQGRKDYVTGSHARGINNISIGICILGSFQKGIEIPKKCQIDSLIEWLVEKCKKYNIPVENIIGHIDAVKINPKSTNTLCPGENLYKLLPEIRERVNKILNPSKIKEHKCNDCKNNGNCKNSKEDIKEIKKENSKEEKINIPINKSIFAIILEIINKLLKKEK